MEIIIVYMVLLVLLLASCLVGFNGATGAVQLLSAISSSIVYFPLLSMHGFLFDQSLLCVCSLSEPSFERFSPSLFIMQLLKAIKRRQKKNSKNAMKY